MDQTENLQKIAQYLYESLLKDMGLNPENLKDSALLHQNHKDSNSY